ncbi:GNAT family N-acetyltransferase [Rhizobium sp. AN69]|uniref:GNAT family N-acetyltransferase n=1 Tax=Rhizobium sp. AN69 TaxID=3035213 RepID=UPI002B260FD7|nr:GNAT family N-acetyltransferase [Rhizobium sp. AN69]
MSDIWVAPEFEGRGAGSLLIRALERQIADRGFAEAFIDVTAANGRALGLYRHLDTGMCGSDPSSIRYWKQLSKK